MYKKHISGGLYLFKIKNRKQGGSLLFHGSIICFLPPWLYHLRTAFLSFCMAGMLYSLHAIHLSPAQSSWIYLKITFSDRADVKSQSGWIPAVICSFCNCNYSVNCLSSHQAECYMETGTRPTLVIAALECLIHQQAYVLDQNICWMKERQKQ